MALNKFEEQMKRQLQEREIQPSEDAWAQVSEKLDAISTTPKRKGYLWYGIAAGFIGFLIISVFFFNLKKPSDAVDIEVVKRVKKSHILKEKVVKAVPWKNEKLVASDSGAKVIQEKNAVKNPLKDEIIREEAITIYEAPKVKILNHKAENAEPILNKTKDIIDSKILEIAVQVNALEKENINLTDAEVDSLLWKAQKEILADRTLNNENTIDPMALLTDVEDELDQSFRDKIFESLRTGFAKVRTAVADSDN